MPFDNIRKRLLLPSQEEIDALAEPSIMDEYIKQNDPEQYDDINLARQLKYASESSLGGIGTAMGTLKAVAPLTEEAIKAAKMEKWIKQMREIDPNYTPEDSVSFLDHTAPDYQEKYQAIVERLKQRK